MMKTMVMKEYDGKLAGWNDAWETLWWRFVEGRMGVLEDELIIQ